MNKNIFAVLALSILINNAPASAAETQNLPAPLISGGYTKLTLFGQEMPNLCGVASRVMEVMAEVKVPIHLITTSSVDISLLVAAEDEDTALNALREAFGL